MPEMLLDIAGLHAGYGETVVLEDINLGVAHGESVSVIGRNGVGKSSLLSTIVGHTDLHRGSVVFGGRDISIQAPYRRCTLGLGYVPQEREVFPSLTVLENLEVARQAGDWNELKVFDLFPQLAERRHNRGNQLSGGEQQMLAIGRALMGNPQLLLMDEPSEGLAPVIVEELGRVIGQLRDKANLSIILVEQHIKFALSFSKRAIVMDRGRIVFDGKSSELKSETKLQSLIGVAG